MNAEDPSKFNLIPIQEANITLEDDSIVDCGWRFLSTSKGVEVKISYFTLK
jgi:hypothetical protein